MLILNLEDLQTKFIIGVSVLGAVCFLLLLLVSYALYLINGLTKKLKRLLPGNGMGNGFNAGPAASDSYGEQGGYNDNFNPRKLPRFDQPASGADSMAPIRSPPRNAPMGYEYNKSAQPPGPKPFGQSPNSAPMGRNDFRNERESQFGAGPRNPMGGSTAYGQAPRGDFREPHNAFSGRSGRIGY